jgi:hypothetical protein
MAYGMSGRLRCGDWASSTERRPIFSGIFSKITKVDLQFLVAMPMKEGLTRLAY